MGLRTYDEGRTNFVSLSKRPRIDISIESHSNFCRRNVTSLPAEILFEILSYLSYDDLYNLRRVSNFFDRIACDPVLWRTYEVMNNEMNTSEIIDELKRMPFLKKFSIDARSDSDDILRQLSLTNKNLEELYITNCTGSTANLYLRSLYLIRILERCNRLHTINIMGTRFRGLKFYRLLADMGQRLKSVSAPATSSQFRTFAKHARHIQENDRHAISAMCIGAKSWAPLHYFMVKRHGHPSTALVSYLYSDFVSIDLLREIR